jgi:hypothetical protein
MIENRVLEIRPRGLEWEVICAGESHGIFFPQDDALVHACQFVQAHGGEVRVFDPSGRLSVIIHGIHSRAQQCPSSIGRLAEI